MFSPNRIVRPMVSRVAALRTKTLCLQHAAATTRSFVSTSRINSNSNSNSNNNNSNSNKQTQLIINAVGTDRLGIVHDMTKEVIDAGGNVGASQAAKLGKYFSLMMLVEVPEAQVESLQESLQQMHDLSASVCLTKDGDGTNDITFASPSSYKIGYKGQLTLEGADNPGIVNKVTKILSTNGLNIDSMETTDELAPGGSTGKKDHSCLFLNHTTMLID
jgi:glycine cleavage system transcriptional repressor